MNRCFRAPNGMTSVRASSEKTSGGPVGFDSVMEGRRWTREVRLGCKITAVATMGGDPHRRSTRRARRLPDRSLRQRSRKRNFTECIGLHATTVCLAATRSSVVWAQAEAGIGARSRACQLQYSGSESVDTIFPADRCVDQHRIDPVGYHLHFAPPRSAGISSPSQTTRK